jgi:hypothetical protein
MADYTGKFQYLNAKGGVAQEGACHVQFDQQTFTLAPDTGAPVVCDLGDIDSVTAADWEIRLFLFNGSTIVLRQFGKAYETLGHDLLQACRTRILQCLLLADMNEVARYDGNFELAAAGSKPRAETAELRLFKTNLAVLPTASRAFQWRLADVDSVKFDPATYEVALQSGPNLLKTSKLAKRTEEFSDKVKEAISALAAHSAQALHATFPFLTPDQLQAAATILREGHAAPVAKLATINPKFPVALAANAVDKDLKPYFDDLLARTAKDALYAGFKLIRAEDSDGSSNPRDAEPADDSTAGDSADDRGASTDADADAPQTLYWFYFPMAAKSGGGFANVVAWEASSRGGRATYFFRLVDQGSAPALSDSKTASEAVAGALRRLDRVLGILNFRRRPIYLSDDELERDPRFHRYAIAARRIPELREVRAAFLGRAIHSSFETWKAQVEKILGNT